MPETPERTALYRLYDAADALLYIGITKNPKERFYGHAYKSWWKQVARKDVTWLNADWRSALKIEAKAIREERPAFNGTHNEPRVPFAAESWPTIEVRYGKSRALAELLRLEIESGRWAPGARVPKRRDLATASGVGEGTADLAYRRLQREGLLQFRPGCGTFVA
jgi:predicted GIY-YIG superfamily endonuclease